MNDFTIVDEYGYKEYSYLNDVINKVLETENVVNAILTVILIDDEKMQELNKKYRNLDRTTDVLSFAYEDNERLTFENRILGEIFISIPKMQAQAKEYGHSEKRELSFLTVHGILHLLGYDHTLGKKEEEEMFAKQELILNEFEF